nr:hypothetical protein [uncultured Acidocella sp.]
MSTTLDPSIITGQLQQQAENTGPQQTQGWLGARQLLLQNQQLAAKQAAGQDFQKSINPLTGQVDYGKFNALLGGDPRAAFAAQDSSQAGMDNQAKYQSNLQAEAKTFLDRNSANSAIFASWTQDPNLSRGTVLDDLSTAVHNGTMEPSEAAAIAGSFPSDPSERSSWTTGLYRTHVAAGGHVQDLLTNLAGANNGSGTYIYDQNPQSPTFGKVMGYLPDTLTPAQAVSTTTLTGAGGSQQMPTAGYAGVNGMGNLVPGGARIPVGANLLAGGGGGMGSGYAPSPPANGNLLTGGATPAPAPAASPPVTARPVVPVSATQPSPVSTISAGSPTPAPAAPASAPPPAAAPGWNGITFPTWAKPGSTFIPAGLDAEQSVGADMYKADMAKIGNIGQQINQLQSILAEGSNANTGALADFFEKAGSTAQQLGLTNGQQATDLQLLQKNVSQLVTSQLGGLGVPTNDKMNEVLYGTPNATMTPEARQGAVAQVLGGLRWMQAEMDAFQSYQQAAQQAGYPISAGAYAQFKAQWQKQVPVAAFQLQDMPPALRAQYLKSIGKDQAQAIYTAMTKTLPAMGVASGG